MKTYLTYGLLMAIGGLLLLLVNDLCGFYSDPAKIGYGRAVGTFGGLAVSITCIVLGTRARRNAVPASQEFTYGNAFVAGFLIVLFASLFGVIFNYIYFAFINPGFTETMVQAQIAKLQEKGLSSSQIEGAEKAIRFMTRPAIQVVFGFFGGVIFGSLITLITAAILKRPAAPITAQTAPPPAL
jgi:hypothetical protein